MAASGPHTTHAPSPSPSKPDDSSLMSKYRSPNCKPDQQPSTLFTFFAKNKQDSNHEFHSFMLSCQAHNLNTPDEVTMKNMKHVSSVKLTKQHGTEVPEADIDVDAHGIALGVQGLKKSASEVSKHRMATNCAPTYDLSNVTSHNRFTCRYLGWGEDENGRKVHNPFQTWKGTLASCDTSLQIDDQLENDVRKLAWEAAGGEEAKLNVNEFLCSIHSIPIQ